MAITYKHLGIYEILSMLSGDLMAEPNLLLETLDENQEHKDLVIQCSNGKITYTELVGRITEII